MPKSIMRSFLNSRKRHLLVTGNGDTEKSGLLKELLGADIPSLEQAMQSPGDWACLDTPEYPQSGAPAFQEAFLKLLEKKRVIAALDCRNKVFLSQLLAREDVFVYDPQQPILPIGCLVLASGLGKRFGSNKLMADFNGSPLASHILAKIQQPLFNSRLAATRHESTAELCRSLDFPVLMHSLPDRSDTVRLGLNHLLTLTPDIKGCMFCPADQPLLSLESLEALVLSFSHSPESILRLSWDGRPGSPVIFGRRYFQELLDLPKGRGGSFLAQKYPGQVQCVSARESWELCDIDTPQDLARMLEHVPHV